MSLKFVTKKLEGHSLEEEMNNRKEKEMEDSGTESDDETEPEPEQGDTESDNLDSGVSLNLRSAAKVGGKSRQLPPFVKETSAAASVGHVASAVEDKTTAVEDVTPAVGDAASAVGDVALAVGDVVLAVEDVGLAVEDVGLAVGDVALAVGDVGLASGDTVEEGRLDDNDNHSSEEELEDIIGDRRQVYLTETVVSSSSSSSGSLKLPGRASAVEKRKWSEVDQSSHAAGRTGSGSSGDEEVSEYMGCSLTPVQFCTSPPLNVYKPRRSQSPPPKLFHLASNGGHLAPTNSLRKGQMIAGAFRPRARGSGLVSTRSPEADGGEGEEERSPNKRHRTTPRPHAIQRPCLDFEKMQQIKTKVVTSWRQGTELSLFCW